MSNGTIIENPGSRELCSDWFDNLIVDQGVNELGTRTIVDCVDFCQVGSGNTPASVTDTSLSSIIASTSNTISADQTFQTSVEPYYIAFQVVIRFAQGVAEGIIAEVGMGWGSSGSTLFSRALIEDDSGNPTTITVLSDEFLDVTYELRIYPDTTDSAGTVSIGGVMYDYTARASEIDNSSYWIFNAHGTQANSSLSRVYSGSIGDVLLSPSGSSIQATSGLSGTYSNNSMQGDCTYTWSLNDGNVGGVRSARLKIGWSTWQIEFSAQSDESAIPKDNTKTLDLTIAHSWSRGSI